MRTGGWRPPLELTPAAVAAIRETVEETAVPVGLSPPPDANAALGIQDALIADRPFADILDETGLSIDAAALTPFARWVPKFHAVRRFDTMFFVARCPSGDWQPRVVERECAGAYWFTAAEVLERDRQRRSAPDLSDAADPGAAGAALVVRADPRRRARLSDRAGDAVGRGDGRRAFHHHPRPSWLSGDAGEARRAMARLSAPPSRVCFTYDKGDPPRRIPFMTGWAEAYFRWFDRCLFISNMLTRSLPPKTFFSLSSARISLLF